MKYSVRLLSAWAALAAFGVVSAVAGQGKALTVEDMMKFRQIEDPVISEDGRWLAYEARPDRGDGTGYVHSAVGEAVCNVERGRKPALSSDSKWAAFALEPPFAEKEKAKKEKPKGGMALVRLSDCEATSFPRVKSFHFSDDGAWLAYQRFEEEKEDAEEKKEEEEGEQEGDKKKEKAEPGTALVLRNLEEGGEREIPFVREWAFDESSRFLAYAVATEDGLENGLFARDLQSGDLAERKLAAAEKGRYTNLEWTREESRLAFVAARDGEKNKPGPGKLMLWDGSGEAQTAVADEQAPEGWMIPSKNDLEWTRDGQRLFFGLRPREEDSEEENGQESQAEGEQDDEKAVDPYDVDSLLDDREVDVWHWDDPRIKPHEKETHKERSERTFGAVYHLDTGRFAQLADLDAPDLRVSQNPNTAVVYSPVPYLKEITWAGFFRDVYLADLKTGERKLAIERHSGGAELSPDGRYLAYYSDGHWRLYDRESGQSRTLTKGMDTPFYNEDHDYPSERPGYGSPGWLEDGSAVLVYDKYDIWEFPLEGDPLCLTEGRGRRQERTFRVVETDPEALHIKPGRRLLLRSYHQKRKNYGWYEAGASQPGVRRLLEEDKKFEFVAKAKEADRLLYTREDYDEFPDLWLADPSFGNPEKVTEANPQISEFAWGKEELVEWLSLDGIPLQGVLIKPGDYQEGRRYPVLVYFYRFFSQRLHEFNEVVVNHRPNFAYYASNGYAVFLPDVRFEIGRPGFSATKCLVPGVQKLVELGVADADAVGLHGHSWSGYQTAFVVTQTDLFAAAVSGAPVSNMTSAYGGIRWGSGLSRQFQYEVSQSRIGGSLWEALPAYIENSPVFYADRINTPLLIQFGDEDGAVPWYQGIELYMALRRLEKPAVFLQYRGEPHHLRKYPNKLDYTLKMREFFDHFLKGAPAPEWWSEGVAYESGN